MRNRVAGIVFLFALFFMAGCVGQSAKDSNAQSADAVKNFVLKDIAGKDVSLDALLKEKKAVLLNFWATWCPPCREEIPGLIDLQKRFGEKGFTVLGVDVGESQVKVESFSKKIGMNYPIVLDKDQRVTEQYRIVGIPTSFLLGPDGKVLGEYHSYSDELVSDVKKAVDQS